MRIGECLKEARAYRGYSQPQLLKRMGRDPRWIARISAHERGAGDPLLSLLEDYCKALNIVVSYRIDRGWSWRPGD